MGGDRATGEVAVASVAARLVGSARDHVWFAAYLIGAVAYVAATGMPTARNRLFLLIGVGLIAASAGRPRAWARVIIDWAPLFFLLSFYDVLRAHADQWLTPHAIPQIRFDEWLFGGTVPTIRLQHMIYTPGHPHVWDFLVFFVYLSHFFVPLVVAGILWKFAYERFRRFAVVFVSLTFLAFLTYALYPAVPPWLASKQADLGPTSKIIDEMWVHVGLRSGASVLSATAHLANPVAAVPSLHAAYPLLLMLFFWRSARRWRWLLPLYPLAMAFTLVYTAEHYVFDIILGWLYATVVFLAGSKLFDAWEARRRVPVAVAPVGVAPVPVTVSTA